jgi:hypothetical protein
MRQRSRVLKPVVIVLLLAAVLVLPAVAGGQWVTASKPSFKDMIPDEGYAGETVDTVITGTNFVDTPAVQLTQSNSTTITATEVSWVSATQINATFDIPDSATVGIWNVVIINPDGESVIYANEFVIHCQQEEEE